MEKSAYLCKVPHKAEEVFALRSFSLTRPGEASGDLKEVGIELGGLVGCTMVY